MRTTREIGNRRAYPKSLRLAAVKAASASTSTKVVAAEFNISQATLCGWKRSAGLAKAQPTGLANHQAAAAAIKLYNTPTLTLEKGNTVIRYQGKLYR